jgi:hypothetical protein
MVVFLFQKDNRVKRKGTDRVGTVMSGDTVMDSRFYRVKFDDGKTQLVAESELQLAT